MQLQWLQRSEMLLGPGKGQGKALFPTTLWAKETIFVDLMVTANHGTRVCFNDGDGGNYRAQGKKMAGSIGAQRHCQSGLAFSPPHPCTPPHFQKWIVKIQFVIKGANHLGKYGLSWIPLPTKVWKYSWKKMNILNKENDPRTKEISSGRVKMRYWHTRVASTSSSF